MVAALGAVLLLAAACTPGVDGRGAIGATIRTSTPSPVPTGAAALPDPVAAASGAVLPPTGPLVLATQGSGSRTLDLRRQDVPGHYVTVSVVCADGPGRYQLRAVGSGPASFISGGGCDGAAGTFIGFTAHARDQRIRLTMPGKRAWRIAIWRRTG